MVARSDREDPARLAREAAGALAAFAGEPAALVTACRRLVDRQPACGPLWWLAARVLAAPDPAKEAWQASDALARDHTAEALAAALPEDVTAVVIGWSEVVAEALVRRGDVTALVVDARGEGYHLAAWLDSTGSGTALVPEAGVAAAVTACDVVVLDAGAAGPDGFVAVAGSGAAAAVARQVGVPVWLVAGTGRMLPGPLWEALVRRLGSSGPAWERADEVVPLAWVDAVVSGDGGLEAVADAVARPSCPVVPELANPPSQ